MPVHVTVVDHGRVRTGSDLLAGRHAVTEDIKNPLLSKPAALSTLPPCTSTSEPDGWAACNSDDNDGAM